MEVLKDYFIFFFEDDEQMRVEYLPYLITGDFDSVDQKIIEYYKGHNVEVKHILSQDNTDFDKLMKFVRDEARESYYYIIVAGCFGGNISQELSNLNTLLTNKDLPLVLLDDNNINFIVPEGEHVIYGIPNAKCGMIPLIPVQNITTKGLQWDMGSNGIPNNLCFGTLISTSNRLIGEHVLINTSDPFLWTFDFL